MHLVFARLAVLPVLAESGERDLSHKPVRRGAAQGSARSRYRDQETITGDLYGASAKFSDAEAIGSS